MYEMTLRGAPPAGLTARFPECTIHREPSMTILSRRVANAAEVDELIERLRSLGMAPVAVRASTHDYEFRIKGQLGGPILRYLQWASRVEQGRTVLRLSAPGGQLRMILEELASNGIRLDHCIRCHAA